MAKFNEPETSNAVNMIVAGTTIKGNIESTNDIRFEGNLVGNLKTSGKLIIGSRGTVKGEIYCKNSDVEGKIEGRIFVQELLTLKSTSLIKGDIVAKRLAIDPGAKFTGSCNMSSNGEQTKQPEFSAKEEEKDQKKS
jgi:cytoskeletal protein CcmA (bactofilin family)